MEVLEKVDYFRIKEILTAYEKDGILEYAEPYLSEKHQLDVENN